MGPNLRMRPARPPSPQQWRRLGHGVAGLVALAVLSGCSAQTVEQWERLGLPEGASTSADVIGSLWIGAWIAAGAIGVFVWGLIGWSVVRYRRRDEGEVPTQVRYNLPIEVLYTVAPFVVIFVFFFHTVVAQQEVLPEEEQGQEQILVLGQQWSWSFNYLGEDGRDEPGDPSGNDVFSVGTVAEEPTLVLPVGREVRFILRSPDVIHSFWIPAFYFKMDVVPGRTNVWVTTPTREGVYAGKCAELCGVSHSRMLFNVRVVSETEYEQHLQSLRAAGNTGVVTGSSETDRIVGLDPDNENGAGE